MLITTKTLCEHCFANPQMVSGGGSCFACYARSRGALINKAESVFIRMASFDTFERIELDAPFEAAILIVCDDGLPLFKHDTATVALLVADMFWPWPACLTEEVGSEIHYDSNGYVISDDAAKGA
jgi:hypothetical protein